MSATATNDVIKDIARLRGRDNFKHVLELYLTSSLDFYINLFRILPSSYGIIFLTPLDNYLKNQLEKITVSLTRD